MTWPEKTGCLTARMSRGFNGQDAMNEMLVVTTSRSRPSENSYRGGVASTLKERDYKDATDVIVEQQSQRKYIVRRLTPLECCRLQGFPDWWCDGVEGSDSAQYKLWGNGIALPCADDVLGRIAREYEREGTDGRNVSLGDAE